MGAGLSFDDRKERKFHLGGPSMTPGTQWALLENNVSLTEDLARHVRGDWGEVDTDDCAENNRCIQDGCRLLSAYHASNGVKFWIITEANRVLTTVLLPEDY